MTEHYGRVYHSNIIAHDIKVYFIKELLRQDMDKQVWRTISSELFVKPYEKEGISELLDLDDDEITVTITSKKGKKIEFTKKLEIYSPTDELLQEWDNTHDKEYVSRRISPPFNQVGGNTGILR